MKVAASGREFRPILILVPSAEERAGDFSGQTAFSGVLTDQNVADTLNARTGCAAAVAAAGGAPIAAGSELRRHLRDNQIPARAWTRPQSI